MYKHLKLIVRQKWKNRQIILNRAILCSGVRFVFIFVLTGDFVFCITIQISQIYVVVFGYKKKYIIN